MSDKFDGLWEDDGESTIDWEATGTTAMQLVDAIGAVLFEPEPVTVVETAEPTLLESLVPYAVVGGFVLAILAVLKR